MTTTRWTKKFAWLPKRLGPARTGAPTIWFRSYREEIIDGQRTNYKVAGSNRIHKSNYVESPPC